MIPFHSARLLGVWAYACGTLLLARLTEGLPFARIRCGQLAPCAWYIGSRDVATSAR